MVRIVLRVLPIDIGELAALGFPFNGDGDGGAELQEISCCLIGCLRALTGVAQRRLQLANGFLRGGVGHGPGLAALFDPVDRLQPFGQHIFEQG